MKREILRFSEVSYRYHTPQGETAAVEGLTFSVEEGSFVAVIGPSGCGKSTLLSLAAGLMKPSSGKVERTGRCGYMLQRDELFPWRTVEKNLFLPLEVRGDRTKESRERARELAVKYGLGDFSGGMRQRAALIRTLVTEPDLLLLDEPFSALDYQTRLKVTSDVAAILRGEKKTALMITHDISEAVSLADRVLVLSRRPARVIASHDLDFEEDDPLKRREHPAFSRWFEVLWKELNA